MADVVKKGRGNSAFVDVVVEIEARMVVPISFHFEDGEFASTYWEDTHDLDDSDDGESVEAWVAKHGNVVYADLAAYRTGTQLYLTELASRASALSESDEAASSRA